MKSWGKRGYAFLTDFDSSKGSVASFRLRPISDKGQSRAGVDGAEPLALNLINPHAQSYAVSNSNAVSSYLRYRRTEIYGTL